MTSWNHGKHYYVEFNFLNLKCYVFKMFLPNFNRIEWKMEKQQLFQNRLFLALFILTWEKYDVIVTSLLIWFGFFSSQIVHPTWKYLRTKFEQSNFKDKGVMEGGWKTPPSATTRQKSPVLIGLSNFWYSTEQRWRQRRHSDVIMDLTITAFERFYAIVPSCQVWW